MKASIGYLRRIIEQRLKRKMQKQEDKDELELRKFLFQIQASEAAGLYGLVITVSSAFLGGALLILEHFIPSRHAIETNRCLFATEVGTLILGGISLLFSILFVAEVRRRNLEAIKNAMSPPVDFDSAKYEAKTEGLTSYAISFLATGMVLVLMFGALLYCLKSNDTEQMRVEGNMKEVKPVKPIGGNPTAWVNPGVIRIKDSSSSGSSTQSGGNNTKGGDKK